MPNVNNIAGKNWVDLGGDAHRWRADNMNRMQPAGFMYTNVEAGDPAFKVYINPVSWVNGSGIDEWPGDDITVGPSVTTYVWLDGGQPIGSQLQTSTVSFPTPTTDDIFFLGYIVTNGSEVVSIDNIQRPWSAMVGGAGVLTVTANAPLVQSGTANNPIIDLPNATPSAAGAMSAADKTKLNTYPASATAVLQKAEFATLGALVQGIAGPTTAFINPAGAADGRKILRLNAGGTAWGIEEFVPISEMLCLTPTAVSTAKDDLNNNLLRNGVAYNAFELSVQFIEGANVVAGFSNHIVRINTVGVYFVIAALTLTANNHLIVMEGINPANTPSSLPGRFAVIEMNDGVSTGKAHMGAIGDILVVGSAPIDVAFYVPNIVGGWPQGTVEAAAQNKIIIAKWK